VEVVGGAGDAGAAGGVGVGAVEVVEDAEAAGDANREPSTQSDGVDRGVIFYLIQATVAHWPTSRWPLNLVHGGIGGCRWGGGGGEREKSYLQPMVMETTQALLSPSLSSSLSTPQPRSSGVDPLLEFARISTMRWS